MNKLYYSWELVNDLTMRLCRNSLKERRFNEIMAVARGGLVPACIVATQLGIRLVDTVCVAAYRGTNRMSEGLSLLKPVNGDGEGVLVIDDLTDTGSTARAVKAFLPRAYFVCLCAKPQGEPFVDAYEARIGQDEWIVFPWEEEGKC